MGGLALVADLDGDGRLDIWTADEYGLRAYEVDGSGGIIANDAILPPTGNRFVSGAAAADYDGDGDLDVYLARWQGAPAPETIRMGNDVLGYNRLLRNDGPAGFVDVTEEAGGVHACLWDGTGDPDCLRSTAVAWGDYDRDGDLDLFVGSHGDIDGSESLPQDSHGPGEPDFLFRNEGDGTFVDVSEQLPREHGFTFTGGFVDVDDDGWLDLYTVHDAGANEPNRVVFNREGVWDTTGADETGLRVAMEGMGLGIGDLNADGLPDFAMAEWGENALLESRRDLGIWLDVTSSYGLTLDGSRGQRVGWGSELADLDNDGDLDLLTQFGHVWEWDNARWANPDQQQDALYLNVGSPEQASFVDVGLDWGVAMNVNGRSVVPVDLNGDGWLDLVKPDLLGTDRFYFAACGAEAWLEVALEQPLTLNRDAVGSKVEVHADGRVWSRTVLAGGTSLSAAGPPVVHFGLGEVERVEALVVRWPDGEIAVLGDIDTRQIVRVVRKAARR